MRTPPANANGHRRRQIRARVLAEETHCYICGAPVDKTLGRVPGKHAPQCRRPDCTGCAWHPKSPVVDEVIPRAKGGNPLDRTNTHLACRDCNLLKGDKTLAWAQAKLAERQGQAVVAPSTTTNLIKW